MSTRSSVVRAAGLTGLMLVVGWGLLPAASAGPTDPALAVTDVRAISAGVAWLQIEGVLPGEDLAHVAYPLQVLVRDLATGTRYVRFEMGGPVVTGDDPALADGLDPGDVVGLLAGGAPALDADVLFLDAGRVDVLLPGVFPAGAAEVQLFVLEPGDTQPVLSNAFVVQIPGGAP